MKSLKVNGKDSFVDFGQCFASREISVPEKRIIKESVPFKNGSYDFTTINGEATFEDRTLTYTFDIIGASMAEVEEQKQALLDWLIFVEDADIYDGYIDGFHFRGSYESCSWSEDWEQSALEVTFSVYPYMIADEETEQSFAITADSKNIVINNPSSHAVIPTVNTTADITITDGTTSISFTTGTTTNKEFKLKKGTNTFTVDNPATVTISFYAEVI